MFQVIKLQILDIQSTLHYIQKKHTMHQLKQALSQIYNIFNETQPLFRLIRGSFLHQQMKKIMNCFGIIYVILMNHIEKHQKGMQMEVIEIQNVKVQTKNNNEDTVKIAKNAIDLSRFPQRLNPRTLGGVHLYNEQHMRHLQSDEEYRKLKPVKIQKMMKQATRQELKSMVVDEINDSSHLNAQPDQILDIFSFKFKYGKQNQVVTFHDELLSIANFFKQSQNEAFQFLNKTKDQTSIITYNDSFKDVMNQIKKQKEEKLKIFTDKIKSAFSSIKSKTQKKVAQIEHKLISYEERQHIKQINKVERETQTNFNIDQEIKFLKRRFADSQEKYKIMMDFKKKELQENAVIGLQLESEIGLKNRQIVYLKLNVQENALMVSNLNRRIKFLTQSNRKIKDIVKRSQEPSKLIDEVESKEDNDKFLKEQADDEIVLQMLRKQRKMAKKILLDKRKSSLLGEKSIYMKRFTQQLDSSKITPKNMLSRNLSQINEGQGSQMYDEDIGSMTSNQNNFISEEPNRSYLRKKTKKVSIIPDSRGQQSSHSIKSRHSFTTKSKKVLKEKHTSEIIDNSNRLSFINKFKDTPGSINEDSVLDECSSEEMDFINAGKQEKMSINSEEYNKIEEMFKRQMSRTKNIINNNKRFSSFNSSSSHNNKNTNKSYFSSQKQNTQQSVPSSQSVNKVGSKSKYSFRNSNEQDNKSLNRLSKRVNSNQLQINQQSRNSIISKGPQSVSKQNGSKNLNIYSSQFSIFVYEPIKTMEQYIQTQNIKTFEPDEETLYSQIKRDTYSNNTIHLSGKTKEAITPNENQLQSQFITRSATQSKMSKSKHLKTLYNVGSKQKQKYLFPKNTEKSVEEDYKNSQSCLQMHEDANKQLLKLDENKKQSFNEQAEKLKEEREMRKLAIKCRTLQQFKTRVAEMHKQRCGHNCKHLQKFVQNFIRYKQESKPKIRMPIKNLCDNINYTASEQEEKNYFPALQKKKN